MEPTSKSSKKIPIATTSGDTCSKAVLPTASHSTRDRTTKRAPDAQDRNSNSKRHCENRKQKATSAGASGKRTAMDGEAKTISARLRNPELWELFHREETEMIITKAGRRMFPVPDFCLAGLDPSQYYGCAIEVIAVDSHRYRHKSSQGWVCAGKGIPLNQSHSKYLHSNSASLGQYWMREGAIFDKLKLSNHILPSGGNIVLNSMQKYRLRLIVTKLGMRHCDRWVFDFPETQFITVTSYQNPRMTQLKIDNNPFAKAFREGKRSSRRDSGEPKAKRRRTRFPSPPPIIRYQAPFINFLSSLDQPAVNRALPPPPPLSHDWPEEPLMTRTIPLQSDVPFPWERDDSLTSIQTFPSINSNLKVEVNGTFHWRDTYAFQPPELPVPEEFQPQFPTQCWSAPPTSAFNLYEDAHAQMQNYISRDQFWRES